MKSILSLSIAIFFAIHLQAQSEPLILKRSIIVYSDPSLSNGVMLSTGDTIYYTPSESKITRLTYRNKSYFGTTKDIEKSKISDGSPIVQNSYQFPLTQNNTISNTQKSGRLIRDGALSMIAGLAIGGIGSYVGIQQNNDNIIVGSTVLGGGLSIIGLINIARGGSLLAK